MSWCVRSTVSAQNYPKRPIRSEVFQGVTHPGRYPVKMRLHRLKIGHERRTLFAPIWVQFSTRIACRQSTCTHEDRTHEFLDNQTQIDTKMRFESFRGDMAKRCVIFFPTGSPTIVSKPPYSATNRQYHRVFSHFRSTLTNEQAANCRM